MVPDALRDGNLEVLTGRVRGFHLVPDGIEATVTTRGSAQTITVQAGRAIDCTGLDTDLSRTANPLLRNLVEQGWLQPDPHRLGALADNQGLLCPARSGERPPLYALGPLRLGPLLETIAIPEIRVQTRDLADSLLTGHLIEHHDRSPTSLALRKDRASEGIQYRFVAGRCVVTAALIMVGGQDGWLFSCKALCGDTIGRNRASSPNP